MGVIMLALSSMRAWVCMGGGVLAQAVSKMAAAVTAQRVVRFMSVSLRGLPFDSAQTLASLTNWKTNTFSVLWKIFCH
jgi:hypothetical protein